MRRIIHRRQTEAHDRRRNERPDTSDEDKAQRQPDCVRRISWPLARKVEEGKQSRQTKSDAGKDKGPVESEAPDGWRVVEVLGRLMIPWHVE